MTLIVGDAFVLMGAFVLSYILRFKILPYYSTYSGIEYLLAAFWSILAFITLFAVSQLYRPGMILSGIGEYTRVFSGVTAGIMLMITVDFLYRGSTQLSRGWLIVYWVLALIFVSGWRFVFRQLVYAARRRGHLLSPAVIVGGNDEGGALAEQLRNSKTSGLYLVGFIDEQIPAGTTVSNGYKILGGFEELERAVTEDGIQEVIIAHTALEREELLSIFRMLSHLPDINVRLSSGLFEIITTGLTVKEIASVPLYEVNKTRIGGVDAWMKRLMDFGASLILLFVLAPLFLLISILIKRSSPGPAFHRRQVMGVNGKQFDAYKFRTMRMDGDNILEAHPDLKEELAQNFKLKDDPRVTSIGRFLRKYSLDEIPQLINVWRGEMSLVGPRMITPPEMEKYGKWGMNLLTVKPGMTGLWQVSGRSDVSYEERINMDMQYIRNWNLGLDIYLILATIPAVIQKRGAY
jgi:exopolysaccharide biosynthesis polyprenyl glycosylphosphotransferase